MYVFCADFVWVPYWYMYGFRADFVWIPYRCMYEFRADFVWKSYSNLVWKVVAKSHTFPMNFPHLQLVHFPYESRTPLFTGLDLFHMAFLGGGRGIELIHLLKITHVCMQKNSKPGITCLFSPTPMFWTKF